MSDTDSTSDIEVGGEAPEAPANNSPWATELATTFQDENLRTQVDGFLRDKVQPYVTKIEQESAPIRDANRLWNDFASEPIDTYVAVTRELFGDEIAERITRSLDDDIDEGDEVSFDPDDDFNPTVDSDGDLDPRIAHAVEIIENQEKDALFNAELERVRGEHSDVEIEEDLFYPFIVAADGDFDIAAETYKQYVSKTQERFGLNPPSPDDIQGPPPVLNQSSSGTSVPPQQEKYDSIDDAIDAFFNEQGAPDAPPTVG